MFKKHGDVTDVVEVRDQAPATNTRVKNLFIGGGILLLLAAIALMLTFFMQDGWFDRDAQIGSYKGKSQEEIQADLNRRVEEGMMNISMASVVTFDHGSAPGEARIENIEANNKDQKITITLLDTNETVYESKAIAPGQYIQYITLDKPLAAGTYEAVAMFDGYETQSHEKIGSAGVNITLIINA